MPSSHIKESSLLKSYGVAGAMALATDLLYTRIFFPGARLVRRSIVVRGRSWIEFGEKISIGYRMRLEAWGDAKTEGALIRFGRNNRINDDVHIAAKISITFGDDVLVASKVFVTDHNHGCYGSGEIHSSPETSPSERPLWGAPVEIGNRVWIGEHVVILPGVNIGEGSIIGAMSTVTRDIPSFVIAAGSPARVIKRYSFITKRWEKV